MASTSLVVQGSRVPRRSEPARTSRKTTGFAYAAGRFVGRALRVVRALILLPILVVLAIVAAARTLARVVGFVVVALSAIFSGTARAVDRAAAFLRFCRAAAIGIARFSVRALAILPKAVAIVGAVFILGALTRSALAPSPVHVAGEMGSASQASEARHRIGMRSATWAGAAMSTPADVPTAYRRTDQTALPPTTSTLFPARTPSSSPLHVPSRGIRFRLSL